MNVVTIIAFVVYGYFMYKLGQVSGRGTVGDTVISSVLAKTRFPVGVIEKIEGNYYLYEKDTTNFLCQAPTLEEIPQKLLENKKISLAAVMCPEESNNQVYWCINGKLKIAK